MLTSVEVGHGSSHDERKAEIFLLGGKEIEHYWPRIAQELDAQPELWDGYFTKESLFERAMDGRLQVWVVCAMGGPIHAVFFSQVLTTDIGNVMQVFWARGHGLLRVVKCVYLAIAQCAEQTGCSRMSVVGREGWARALRDFPGVRFEGIGLSAPVQRQRSN